jgi:ParB-like chromosome segregation protein Spo0J
MKRPSGGVQAPPGGLECIPKSPWSYIPMSDTIVKLDGLEIHSLALVFPIFEKEDFEKLTNDIREHGQRQPITLFEGKVLDGRNRVEAMRKAGKDSVLAIPFKGTFEDARDYVVSMNDVRRHMTTSQRAMVAAGLADMKQGARTDLPQNCGMSTEAAAKKMKVSRCSVETAKAVKKADPALAEEVKEGKTKLSTAAKKTAAAKTTAMEKKAAFLAVLPKQKPTTTKIKTNRHDERMKSARYKLAAFIKDYADMAEWKTLAETIKTHPEMTPAKLGPALKPSLVPRLCDAHSSQVQVFKRR